MRNCDVMNGRGKNPLEGLLLVRVSDSNTTEIQRTREKFTSAREN
jgi:hypothetical protein